MFMQACAFPLCIDMTLQVELCLIAWCIGCTNAYAGGQLLHCRSVTLNSVIVSCAVNDEEICNVLIDMYCRRCPKLICTL